MIFQSPLWLGINVILALVVSLWLYIDARARDYIAFVWGFSAFASSIFLMQTLPILGPFLVLAVYLIMRPKGALRNCPHCQKKYLAELANCPICRRATKKDCYRCHEAVYTELSHCPYCNTKL